MKYIVRDRELKSILRAAECNSGLVRASDSCLCLFCGESFSAATVDLTDTDITDGAVCPCCGYDAILPSAAGFSPSAEQRAELRRIISEGVKTECYTVRVSGRGEVCELLLSVSSDLDALAYAVMAVFDIPLGARYDFTDRSRRYFFHLPERRNERHSTIFGVRLHLLDTDGELDMWCDGRDYKVTILGKRDTARAYLIPEVIGVEGNGLYISDAEDRVRKRFIKTRNFYWGYTPED